MNDEVVVDIRMLETIDLVQAMADALADAYTLPGRTGNTDAPGELARADRARALVERARRWLQAEGL